MNRPAPQQGFTLIELIVVIVILGILAATALPRFADFSGDAGNVAAQAVAGSIASATAMNYSRRLMNNTAGVSLNTSAVCRNPSNFSSLVPGMNFTAGEMPTTPTDGNTYDVSGTGDCAAVGPGNPVLCTITGQHGSATATVLCSN